MSHNQAKYLSLKEITCNRPSSTGRGCCLSSCKRSILTYLVLVAAAAILTCALEHNKQSDNDDIRQQQQQQRETSLYYTRLRYDRYYLPIYKSLQKQLPYEEDEHQFQVKLRHDNDANGNGDDDDGELVDYYVNPNVSLHDLSQNDLILESLDQVYLSRLLQSYEHSYDNPEDRRRASDPRIVSRKRCERELDYLLNKLKLIQNFSRLKAPYRGLTPEMATFFDSYASQEAGVLMGNIFWVGNWQQCKKRHIFDPYDRVNFRGRYCVASIQAPEWLEKIEKKVNYLNRIDYFKFDNQELHYRKHFRIQLGICLPESCDSTIFDERRKDISKLTRLKLSQPYDSYNLTDLYCLPDETSPLREIGLSGRLLIRLALLWAALIVFSTLADVYDLVGLKATHKHSKNLLQRIIVSFSLIGNYKHLSNVSRPLSSQVATTTTDTNKQQQQQNESITSLEEAPNKPTISDLNYFDGFKVLATMIILLGHIGLITLQFSQYQLDFHTIGMAYFHFLASTAFFVDWFFCMTGFITAYASFATKGVYTNRIQHWLYSIFHRYWRLAPIYLLTFWFCRDLFKYTSNGPLWDYGTSQSTLRSICQQESWLAPLTLTSNFHPLHRECIMPAWYIANDMQFYLITPALLLLLAYRARLGWLIMIGMSLVSVLARAHRYYVDSHARHLELMHPRYDLVMRNNWDLHRIYLWPHYRISPYLIGLLAGHYAFMVKSGQWKSPFFQQQSTNNIRSKSRCGQLQSKNRALLAWIGLIVTCTVSMASFFLDLSFPRSLEPYAKQIVTIVYSSGHTIAGCGIAALFLSLLFGHWPKVRQFMELPLWTQLAKINFFVYLFQVEIITWASNARTRLPEAHAYEQYKLFFFLGPILYALAWLVTLLVSNPLAKLELELVGVYMRKTKPDVVGGGGGGGGAEDPAAKSRAVKTKLREKHEQVAAAAAAVENGKAGAAPVEVFDGPKSSSGRPIKRSPSSSSARC